MKNDKKLYTLIDVLRAQHIIISGLDSVGRIKLPFGYLLQISDKKDTFILWRYDKRIGHHRLKGSFRCKGKGWADQVVRVIWGMVPDLIKY